MTKTQRCPVCCTKRPLAAFGKSPRVAGGRNKTCQRCVSRIARWKKRNIARVRAWKESYRPRKRVAEQGWRDRNRVRHRANDAAARRQPHRQKKIVAYRRSVRPILREKHRAWRAAHPGYMSANTKQWRARYPDRARATGGNMYAKRKGAVGTVTARQWKEICLFYGNACAQCHAPERERPLTIDHFIPLIAGGSNDWTNVWPLCLPCNQTKHTTVPTGAPPHVAALRATAVTISQEASA